MKIVFMVCVFFLMVSSSVIAGDFPTKADVFWLTQNIYWEARGEDINGKVMVGVVTLKRLEDGRWGDTVKDVVTSNKQFSWYSDGKSDIPKDYKAWKESRRAAIIAIATVDSYSGVLFYHNDEVDPFWNDSMLVSMIVGKHIFYEEYR